jgi:hypothetical protein
MAVTEAIEKGFNFRGIKDGWQADILTRNW